MNGLLEVESTTEIECQLALRVGGRVRGLKVLRINGRLVLEGRCLSYYAKQVVTHAALELAPLEELVNDIFVEGYGRTGQLP